MHRIPVIAVFDIGKTNKKVFLFDEYYQIVYEQSVCLPEMSDEEGFPCENITQLRRFILERLRELKELSDRQAFSIVAINISSYGASLVYVDQQGDPVAPLYNYLKPFPEKLEEQFYASYGGRNKIALETASPCSGSLNSGLQLYRIKYESPRLFTSVAYALHLPQYLSSLITGLYYSDITSIGCHTHLWDYRKHDYHKWVYLEGLDKKLAPLFPSDRVIRVLLGQNKTMIGVGMHDSSAALIPYLSSFSEPFILISTGTWCISLNPFNQELLTLQELQQDCLYYISYNGIPVKASRLFSGYKHEQESKRIAGHFQVDPSLFHDMPYDISITTKLQTSTTVDVAASSFSQTALSHFLNAQEAYHALMIEIVTEQYHSAGLLLQKGITRKIFVDGGFSKNEIFMNLLAMRFSGEEVYAASIAQATAMGAALAIHSHWNIRSLPDNIIVLKHYPALHYETTL